MWSILFLLTLSQADSICEIFADVTNLPGWFDCGIHPCDWYVPEVTCSPNTTNITSITIDNIGLSGSLRLNPPGGPSLTWPSTLESLQITNTNLTGDFVSSSLYNCLNLRSLNISNNYFTGEINIDNNPFSIDNTLHIFDASYNNFTSFTLELSSKLHEIYINNNQISSQFDTSVIGGSTEYFTIFDFSDNNINGTITIDSRSMKYLDGSNNRLNTISWIGLSSNSSYFDLSNNNIYDH